MRRILALVASVALLTGCGASTGIKEYSDNINRTDMVDKSTDDVENKVAGVGDEFTYVDGLGVELLSLKRVARDQWAAGGVKGDLVAVATIKINNGTKERFDASMTIVSAASGPDSTESEAVFQDGVDGNFSGTILPGKSRTAKFGFAVKPSHRDDIIINVAPSFDYDEAVFEGSV